MEELKNKESDVKSEDDKENPEKMQEDQINLQHDDPPMVRTETKQNVEEEDVNEENEEDYDEDEFTSI